MPDLSKFFGEVVLSRNDQAALEEDAKIQKTRIFPEELINIKGSWLSELDTTPEGCPEKSPVNRAYYDILPHLLSAGYEDQYLVFGQGKYWYGIGETRHEAIKNLEETYKHQKTTYTFHLPKKEEPQFPTNRYLAWRNKRVTEDFPELKDYFGKISLTEENKKSIEEFARVSRWPLNRVYEENNWAGEYLSKIPGSFWTEAMEDPDCVLHPEDIAYYDILPHLLERGFEGRGFVFGFGKYWWAIGNSPSEATENLMEQHKFQMPTYPRTIKRDKFAIDRMQRVAEYKADTTGTVCRFNLDKN